MSHVFQSFRRVASDLRFAPKALVITGAVAVTVAGAATALPSTAQASSGGLQYHRGYSLQHGWYCYGWANGAYHCTRHWGRVNGRIISYNPAWTPNYGSVSASKHLTTPVSHPTNHALASGGVYNPGRSAIVNEIRSVFGPYANQALAIASCESGLNPNARNPRPVGRAHAAGLFQILDTSTWYTTSSRNASPYNADANIRAAYEIFHRDGNNWREWACRP